MSRRRTSAIFYCFWQMQNGNFLPIDTAEEQHLSTHKVKQDTEDSDELVSEHPAASVRDNIYCQENFG